jgi:hypothetical protein
MFVLLAGVMVVMLGTRVAEQRALARQARRR